MKLRILGIVLCLSLASGCSSFEGPDDRGFISQDGAVTLIPVEDREQPVDASGEDLDGRKISLADLRGGVVVVNVWGSWCGPCETEQPDLNEAAEETSEIADFLGINIRDASTDNARTFVRSFEVPYPSIYDPESKALLAFSEVVPVRAPPTTFVLDAEGRIAAAVFGALPSVGTLVDIIEDVESEASG